MCDVELIWALWGCGLKWLWMVSENVRMDSTVKLSWIDSRSVHIGHA